MKELLESSGVLGFIDTHEAFHIVGHKEPDGDCVGSQLALASLLERLGKKVQLLSAGPFDRTEIAGFAGRFESTCTVFDGYAAAVIIVDCSSVSRIGSIADSLPANLPMAFIDHHAAGEVSGDVRFVDAGAPAVTCLVQSIIEAYGQPTVGEAGLLLFGLCTDTGFFRHLDGASGDVFRQVSRLVDAGASPKEAHALMYGGKPLASRQLMGMLLGRVKPYYDGKLLFTSMDLEDQKRFGFASRDSDMLYQMLLTVEEMEVAVVVRQESGTECTVGFRSRNSVDVASIAASFGGGGHRLAAGLHLRGSLEEVSQKIIEAFVSVF